MISHGPTYIYSSQSIWDLSVRQTKAMLETALDSREIKITNTLDDVNSETKLLVIPGGCTILIEEELAKVGAQKVKSYIEGGGRYLGICAGAMLATQNIVPKYRIDVDKTNLFNETIDLAKDKDANPHSWHGLYPGTYTAPHIVKEYTDPNDPKNLCAVDVVFSEEKSLPFKAVHYSGPAFFSKPEIPQAKTLLKYSEGLKLRRVKRIGNDYQFTSDTLYDAQPIAVLSYPYGAGKMVLSGVHMEIDPLTFPTDARDTGFPQVLPEGLLESEPARKNLIHRTLKELKMFVAYNSNFG